MGFVMHLTEPLLLWYVYLQSVYGNNCVISVLIAPQTRFAPKCTMFGVTRSCYFELTYGNHYGFNTWTSANPFYCADPTATLYWISNQKLWKHCIEHRMLEIHHLSDSQLWHHCPGNLNLADIPSRGMNGEKLSACDLWWKGPEILCQYEDQWPDLYNIPASKITTNSELTKKPTVSTHIC